MLIDLGTVKIDPPVLLAPMAGITDMPFRSMVARFGAGLMVSEMVATQEMLHAHPGVRARAELGEHAQSTSIQIAGRDAFWMGEAAKLIECSGARLIDINMGCPAKKVTSGYSGSALMRTPDFALELVEAVVNATNLPVTLKMRLGWDDESMNAPYIASRAADLGIRMITVHGRTRCQFYKGVANWSAIRAVKQAVNVPVIANGDIIDATTARQALQQSGADGVMIGRGAQGQPWKIAQVAQALHGGETIRVPQGRDLIDLIHKHYNLALEFYGAEIGVRVFRKHIGWYLNAQGIAHPACKPIMTEKNPMKVKQQIADILLNKVANAA